MTLTHRQKQVVSGIAASIPPKQIASRLSKTVKCVQYHLREARLRLGFPPRSNEARFTRYAYENHLIKIDKTGAVVDSYLNSCAGEPD